MGQICMTDADTTQDNFILPAQPVGGLPISQTYIYMHAYIYTHTYMIACDSQVIVVVVCVCVCVRAGVCVQSCVRVCFQPTKTTKTNIKQAISSNKHLYVRVNL